MVRYFGYVMFLFGALRAMPVDWTLLQTNVCFEAKGDNYGEVIHQNDGFLTAVRLKWLSGGVSCSSDYKLTKFGCDGKEYYSNEKVSVFITGTGNASDIIFPYYMHHRGGFYNLYGRDANSANLVFSNFATPPFVEKGMKLRVWYGEDLFNGYEINNLGKTCVDVYGRFKY